jgi:hypothetical protein
VRRLHARFNAEGIVIPFPIRTIDYRGGRPSAEALSTDAAPHTASK